MAAFYVCIWLSASAIGAAIYFSEKKQEAISVLAFIWLAGAILSIAVALVQWTGAFSLGIYGVDLPPGARPFGNVAQPNHLCTIAFMGICGAVWLYQRRLIGISSFWLAVICLIFGMVLSQSRTGWLQIAWFGLFLIAIQGWVNIRIRRLEVFFIIVFYFFLVSNFDKLSAGLLIPSARSISDQVQPGLRIPYWLSMLDAISREPLWGYGWLQIGVAQQTVALSYSGFGSLYEHAHNFVLDVILWNGLLFGGFILALALLWIWQVRSAALDRSIFWLAMALGGIFIHGMLEFPLEYSYFLIPVGLIMGAMSASQSENGQLIFFARNVALLFLVGLSIAFFLIVKDYFTAEENYRQLRIESARIGTDRITSPAPDLLLLNQLEAFLRFARIEAKPGMSASELDFMKAVAERYGYPPVLFRYALALGINGKGEVARDILEKICRIHENQRCEEAVEGWRVMENKYPELKVLRWRS